MKYIRYAKKKTSSYFEETKRNIKEWLAFALPAWADFEVKSSSSRYLGVEVGPAAASRIWSDAFDKYMLRAAAVARCGLALSPHVRT